MRQIFKEIKRFQKPIALKLAYPFLRIYCTDARDSGLSKQYPEMMPFIVTMSALANSIIKKRERERKRHAHLAAHSSALKFMKYCGCRGMMLRIYSGLLDADAGWLDVNADSLSAGGARTLVSISAQL